ncbi:MAG: ThuA domain-containing protein [Anaerohalosphaera sp.]|nr:ThuA domain-containing protein [Anaerohalosphaera sp.]
MRLTRRTFMAASALGLTNVALGQASPEQKPKKRIIFIAGPSSHAYGLHEHPAGCRLLADCLNALPDVKAEVFADKWPADDSVFNGADAVVIFSDGGTGHIMAGHEETIEKLTKSRVGVGFMHYALIPQDGKHRVIKDAIGGYYETNWSVNPIWQATFKKLPEHPVMNGVKPFTIKDEWYYHMRFVPEQENVKMLLSDLPPAETLNRPEGPHSNNPHVRKAVLEEKQPQHLAWVYTRKNGGRGFGFTGGHYHWNWAHDDYRTFVLNAVGWLAGIKIPPNGIPSKTPTYDDLMKPLGVPPKKFNATEIKKLLSNWKNLVKD